ncbi:MAG: HIT family protein [Rickettsiaceae bacterium]|nr:HIT family protein [Rickettsiaceae bacterium]
MSPEKFEINPRLLADGSILIDLELSTVILVDNSLFPWLILVPRKNNLRELIDLSPKERIVLMDEISFISELMLKEFSPHKLNVATLGNVVSQLHIHIIARYEHDACWPAPVFGASKEPYKKDGLNELAKRLRIIINNENL